MSHPRPRKPYTQSSSGSDSDGSEDPLDEEHQEQLIQTLQTQDVQKTIFYHQIFLGIILLSSLPYLLTFLSFSTETRTRDRLSAVLCVSSLACSGYILYYLPLDQSSSSSSKAFGGRLEKTPVEKFLPWLNGVLAGVLVVAGWSAGFSRSTSKGYEEMVKLGLPAIIFLMTIVVRKQLAPVNFEDLQRARYELKGA